MTRWPVPDPDLPWPQRFWQKVDASGDCWLWTGAKGLQGYGHWTSGLGIFNEQYAHRISWLVLVGPIPEGYWIDHLCRNPPCLNPDHLEPVSPRTNIQRGKNVGRPIKSHCPKGHLLEGGTLRVKPSGERVCRICSHDYYERFKAGEARVPRSTEPLLVCKRGHDYSETAYIDPQGRRHCRACRAVNAKAFRLRWKGLGG